jgi:hypothetical protein
MGRNQGYGQSSSQSYPQSSQIPMGTVQSQSSSSSLIPTFFWIALLVGGGMFLYYRMSAAKAVSPLVGVGASMPPPLEGAAAASAKAPTAFEQWASVAPGSFITLSDAQALQDSKDRGQGLNPIDYTVESVAVAKDSEGFGSWALTSLNDGHQKLMLMV